MKTVTFAQALNEFQQVFQLAAGGETVVIERDHQRVALRRMPEVAESESAPPGYFLDDYSPKEIDELNEVASRGPQAPLASH